MIGEKSKPPKLGKTLRNGSKIGSVMLIKARYKGLYGSGENHEIIALITITQTYKLHKTLIRLTINTTIYS
jgi:hypothetical protein